MYNMDKDIFTLLGELYYNFVRQSKILAEKEAEIKTKDAMVKDMKDRLDANIRQRGALTSPES